MENVKANVLEGIYSMQLDLVKHYQQIEGLPEYPVDIENRAGQKLLKDFNGRFIEELGEADESLENTYLAVSANDKAQAAEHLKDYNLEISDALHFWVEFLIFAGYPTWDSFSGMIQKCLSDDNYARFRNLFEFDRPMKSLISMGGLLNYENHRQTRKPSPDMFIINPQQTVLAFQEYKGGNHLSTDVLGEHAKILFHLISRMSKAVNQLKNRDWTKEDRYVNVIQFEYCIFEASIILGSYLEYMGFTETGIYRAFYITTQKNLNRIKNGY